MVRKAMAIGSTLVVLAGLTAACTDSGDSGVSIDATGTVEGLAWVDRNGNGTLQSNFDGPAPNLRIRLVPLAGGAAAYSRETGPNGNVTLAGVMVGEYRVAVDSSTVGDTLEVLRVDSASLTVGAGETVGFGVALTFPFATTDSLRVAPLDRRFFVEGEVISEWDTFGDGTIHIRDETGAIRAVRVQANNAAPGDRVRMLGTVSIQAGRPVLKDAILFLLETGVESPDPVSVTTGVAATANGGELDAELVRVLDAIIQDTLRNSFNELVLTVDDGSGPLDIVLDRDIPFSLGVPASSALGSSVDATGVLLPPASGAADVWVVKPRNNSDIVVR